MGSASSIDRQPSCPYSRMCAEEIKKAKNTRYINGEASDFYHLCSDGKTDQIREILENSDRKHIDELVKREANGDTALHVAAEKGHNEIVKLLLEHRCCRTIRNHTGRLAIEMASNEDTKRLFIRPEGSDRFHDLDSTNTIAHYLPEKKKETDENEVNALEYVQRFKTEEEIYEYSLNHQTTAMWLRFFNWFSRTFPSLLQQDFLKPDSFDLDKNKDFDNFLKTKAGQYYNRTRSEFHEAYERNSIEPYLTIYSRETHGFYRLLNKQLADSASEADTSPHLCDRFIIEFHIRSDELKGRAFRGIVYRGATMDLKDIKPYEEDCEHKQRGVILFRAFTSTSIDRNVAFDFIRLNPPASHQRAVLFVIDIKTKSPTIIGMADKSDHPEEKEILILPGNLFIVKEIRKDVTHTIKKKTMTITEIHLEYLHIPVSFLKKLKHTLHSARRDNLTA